MIVGQHLLIECRGQHSKLQSDDLNTLMNDAANAGRANVLASHFHEFGGHGGITGVLLLAESHITVHTWPEIHYAAFDIFMCGHSQAEKAAIVIANLFPEDDVCIKSIDRGLSVGENSGYTLLVPSGKLAQSENRESAAFI